MAQRIKRSYQQKSNHVNRDARSGNLLGNPLRTLSRTYRLRIGLKFTDGDVIATIELPCLIDIGPKVDIQ